MPNINTIILHYRDGKVLCSFDINTGEQLTCMDVGEQLVTMKAYGDYLVHGGLGKRVTVRRADTLQMVRVSDQMDSSVRHLDVTSDGAYIIATLASGSMMVNALS